MQVEEAARISVPNGRNRSSWASFCAELEACEARQVHFSFRDVDFVTPGWMLLIGRALKQFRERRPGSRCRVVDTASHAMMYAGHAGFFAALGLPRLNKRGVATNTFTFLPITTRRVRDLFEGQPLARAVGDIIQEDAERMAGILTQSRIGTLFDTLSYSIREILRNVVEHSDAERFQIAAQCWPAAGKAEIAVIDSGIGIKAGLSANGKFCPSDDAAALLLATQPGVSGVMIPKRTDDAWANSGYGLYMAHGLAEGSDGFMLASGSATLIGGLDKHEIFASALDGTCVVLRLRTDQALLEDRLRNLVSKAGGKPSAASMSVRVQ